MHDGSHLARDNDDFYDIRYSVPVIAFDDEGELIGTVRWDFRQNGWVDSKWSDGCDPSDYHLNELVDSIQEIKMPKKEIKQSAESLKKSIIDTMTDTMTDFLYYDRREDECLQVGEIENAIKNEIITIDEILDVVRKKLEDCNV